MKCGIVGLFGCTNVGKSTLLNALLGRTLSITSAKVQTTRYRVSGILTQEDAQAIIVDTPGLYRATKDFDKAIQRSIDEAVYDVDHRFFLMAADRCHKPLNRAFLDKLRGKSFDIILNKIDTVAKTSLLASIQELSAYTDRIWLISALHGDGLEALKERIFSCLPDGPWLYPGDTWKAASDQFVLAEMLRGSVYTYIHQEIPYGVHVETELCKKTKPNLTHVMQRIYIARKQFKPILLGARGQHMKRIATHARKEMETFLGTKVFLDVQVTVDTQWQQKKHLHEACGLRL